MKNITLIFGFIILVAACKPEPPQEIGPKYSLTTGINGTWQISNVQLIDKKSPSEATEDFSDFFLSSGNAVEISFNAADMTYEVVGDSSLFGNGGRMEYNHPEYPSEMWLISGNDTTTFQFTKMVREFDANLYLAQNNTDCNGKVYTQYQFTFNRIQP